MSPSKAEQIKQRGQQTRAQQEQQREAAEQPGDEAQPAPPRQRSTVRVKPVRRTVDLSPVRHAELDAWCSETARELGVARITGQAVISTLVGRLLTDETLARKVRQDLREDR